MDQLPRLGKRELICLLLFTCNYVVSVWRGFLFLWVLGIGYVISSPEPDGSQGELIVYTFSGVGNRRRGRGRQQFQTSFPLKPLSQSKPNCMWSLLGKGEQKFIYMVEVT